MINNENQIKYISKNWIELSEIFKSLYKGNPSEIITFDNSIKSKMISILNNVNGLDNNIFINEFKFYEFGYFLYKTSFYELMKYRKNNLIKIKTFRNNHKISINENDKNYYLNEIDRLRRQNDEIKNEFNPHTLIYSEFSNLHNSEVNKFFWGKNLNTILI